MKVETIKLSVYDIARMVNTHWTRMKKVRKMRFLSEDAEEQYKTLFILGYHSALTDMVEFSGRLVDLDNILDSKDDVQDR